MTEGVWDLSSRAGELNDASDSWSAVARALSSAADDFNAAGRAAGEAWSGDAATAFDSRRSALVADLDAGAVLAGQVCSAMLNAAGSVRVAQAELDLSWARVAGFPRQYGPYSTVIFDTETPEDRATADAAIAAALATRASLDSELSAHQTSLGTTTSAWRELTARWASIASGGSRLVDLPAEDDQVRIVLVDGQAIVSAGAGDNTIVVSIDPLTGEQIVTIDGVKYRIPGGSDLTIRGGGGDDSITLPKDVTLSFTVVGGEGLDRITSGGGKDRIFASGGDDEVEGGGGADFISGGGGHDYLDGQDGGDRIVGGAGRDTLYGLGGKDRLSGGSDADYLEGGKGADTLLGAEGDDVLSGGRGDDQMFGGGGDDVSYGGLGTDRTLGGAGQDTSHDDQRTRDSSNESNVNVDIPRETKHITIEGSDEFIARVEADLDALRSSPSGQALLKNLEENYENSGGLFGWGRDSLTIREFPSQAPDYPVNSTANSNDGQHVVRYLPTIDDFMGAPPIVVLQHELGHVYDYANDTYDPTTYRGEDQDDHGDPNGERVAAGLPIDHDRDPSTPEIIDPRHPFEYTENGLREEMGLPPREHY